jgi:hypothetical protein
MAATPKLTPRTESVMACLRWRIVGEHELFHVPHNADDCRGRSSGEESNVIA